MTLATAESPEQIKARGAFYTPPELTRFLSTWAIRSPDDRVLEPSSGDGAFVTAITARFADLGRSSLTNHLVGVERDATEAAKAIQQSPSADIRTMDFFDLDPADAPSVDAAIGNPPYIRYHGFSGSDRRRGLARAKAQGVTLTNLASSWAHFVVHAAGFLNPTGRLALVLPAELLHTDYGAAVRQFLLKRFPSVVILAFDRPVFVDAQVDAVLLLASDDDDLGVRVIRLRNESELASVELAPSSGGNGNGHALRWSASVDVKAADTYERALAGKRFNKLGAIASVDIGFVSGANAFFVLSRGAAAELGLPDETLTRTVRRPSDTPGLETRDDELYLLLDLAGRTSIPQAVLNYLAQGEELGIPLGFKARNRKPWYAVRVPKKLAAGFLPYMSHFGPRLIANRQGARSTNLLHGVSLLPGAPSVEALSAAMAGSLTLLSAEIEGRAYGGGVLKLETREAERLAVPTMNSALGSRLEQAHMAIDGHVRSGRLKDAAMIADELIGLDHESVWNAYLVFRERRMARANTRRRKQAGASG